MFVFRASIRQRSRSQLSNLIPESSVPIAGELGPIAYAVSQADKVCVCVCRTACIHLYVWVVHVGVLFFRNVPANVSDFFFFSYDNSMHS